MKYGDVNLGQIEALINKLGGEAVLRAILSGTAKVIVEVLGYLLHLASVTLAPTKGNETIAEAKDIFVGYLDPNFQRWGTDVVGNDTVAQAVSVYELRQDGTFAQIFSSLGQSRALCMTQGQIVEFCRSHRDQLRQAGYMTFFLFEVEGELFVANVFVKDGLLCVEAGRFGFANVWRSGYRIRVVVKK